MFILVSSDNYVRVEEGLTEKLIPRERPCRHLSTAPHNNIPGARPNMNGSQEDNLLGMGGQFADSGDAVHMNPELDEDFADGAGGDVPPYLYQLLSSGTWLQPNDASNFTSHGDGQNLAASSNRTVEAPRGESLTASRTYVNDGVTAPTSGVPLVQIAGKERAADSTALTQAESSHAGAKRGDVDAQGAGRGDIVDHHHNPPLLHGFAEGQVEGRHHIHHDTKILSLIFGGKYVWFYLAWLAVSIATGISVGVKTHSMTTGIVTFSGVFLIVPAGIGLIMLLIKLHKMREVAEDLLAPAPVP